MNNTTRKTRTRRQPKVGDRVTPIGKGARIEYPSGTVGVVVGILQGACGPIVAIQFPDLPDQTVDLFWRKTRVL